MTCRKLYVPVLTALFFNLALPITQAHAEEIGINSAVKGTVTIKSEDEIVKAAQVEDPVFLGDEVKSQTASSLQILLKDNTVFTVGPQAELTIDEFVYNPSSNSNKIKAKVQRGMFRYMSGNAAKTNPDDITIETPTASMGIRGTIFEAIVGPEALLCAEKEGVLDPNIQIDYTGATLIVLRGPGGQSNTLNRRGSIDVTAGGKTVTLDQSGMATFVSNETAQPSKTFFISDVLYNFFNRRLRSQPTGDENFMPFDLEPRLIRPEIRLENEEGLVPYDPANDLDLPRTGLFETEGPEIDNTGGGNLEIDDTGGGNIDSGAVGSPDA